MNYAIAIVLLGHGNLALIRTFSHQLDLEHNYLQSLRHVKSAKVEKEA